MHLIDHRTLEYQGPTRTAMAWGGGFVLAVASAFFAEPVCAEGPLHETPSGDEGAAGFDLARLQTPGGLTEKLAVERALATAPSIERAESGVRIARAGATQAFLGVLPRLDVSFDYTRLFNVEAQSLSGGEALTVEQIQAFEAAVEAVADGGRPADVASSELHALSLGVATALSSGEAFPVPLNRYTFNAQMAWPVSRVFFEVLPAYEAAQKSEEASRHTLAAERATIVLQAREAFYSYARALGSQVVAEASLAQIEAQRHDIRILVEAGSAAPVELDRAESRVAWARVAVAQARAGLRVAAVGLRVLLHDSGAELGLGEDLTVLPATALEPQMVLVDRALAERSELQALIAARRSAALEVKAAGGVKLPALALAGNLDIANPNPLIVPAVEEFRATWSVGALLSWSPNDFADADARQSRAEGRSARVRAELAALKDAVRLEVAQAYAGYAAARESYPAAATGIQAAEENYRVRREQLDAGTIAQTDLIQAEAELTAARLQLLNAAIDARVAQARLRRAVGLPQGS